MNELFENKKPLQNEINKPLEIKNGFLIEEIDSPANDAPLRISGYFKKWGNINGNGEKYAEDAYDDFIEEYFVKNKLNIPVDVLHYSDIYHLVGKVISLEKNTVGLKAIVELSKGAIYYDNIVKMLKDGLLQGFSDMGWAYDYEYERDYIFIKKAMIQKLSIVDLPAEPLGLEFKNATQFKGFNKSVENAKTEQHNELPFLK